MKSYEEIEVQDAWGVENQKVMKKNDIYWISLE